MPPAAILRDEAEAEDVVQETFVRAFAGLSQFRGEAQLATWLTRIALNEALGRLRRRQIDIGFDEGLGENEGAGDFALHAGAACEDPERAAAKAQIRLFLEQAIDELPEHFRLVFVLRDVEELDIEDTAKLLGLRPETVKTRLHRARKLLRAFLQARLSTLLSDIYPFAGKRCDRICEAVLARLAALRLAAAPEAGSPEDIQPSS